MPGSYRKESKAFEPTMEDLGLRRAPVSEKPAPKASDKEYAFRTEEEWFQEWKTKYEDEDFMSLDPSVGGGGNNLTANERRIMKEKMEKGEFAPLRLESMTLHNAGQFKGKKLANLIEKDMQKTFTARNKRRMREFQKDETLQDKFWRIVCCAPTPGKIPSPKKQRKFLEKCYRADYSQVLKALQYGQPVDYADADNRTGLYLATLYGYTPIVTILLVHNADPEKADAAKGRVALHLAAMYGYGDIVDLLAENDARMSPMDKQGVTPLMLAASNGHKKTVELLVECGSRVNCSDARKWTELHYAAASGWPKICQYLMDQGSDATKNDLDGCNPAKVAEVELERAEMLNRRKLEKGMQENERRWRSDQLKRYKRCISLLKAGTSNWRDVEAAKRMKESGFAVAAEENKWANSSFYK
jgi:hypothetical protein